MSQGWLAFGFHPDPSAVRAAIAAQNAQGISGGSNYEQGEPPRVLHASEDPPPSVVYVIDDVASMRRSLSRRLKLAAWQVHVFESAEAFLADLDTLVPGCLVLDIRLGGMSGLDLLAHMKVVRPTWPIIAMSGSNTDNVENEALRLGARVFLRKPFVPQELIDAITRAFA